MKRKIGIGVDLAAGESSAFVVATEVMPDGTYKVHRGKPFLRPAVAEALAKNGGSVIPNSTAQAWKTFLKARSMVTSTSARSFGPGSHTYTIPMAHPVWPYGTVIKPTAANDTFPDYVRQMVLNVNYERGAIVALQLTPPASDWADIDFYMHSLSNLHERWEISEEVPD